MAVWNNETVHNVGSRAKGTLGDFQKFILRGNVVDLAVGIMIGAAFSGVVTALVGDDHRLLDPCIGYLFLYRETGKCADGFAQT
ncbi:MAG: MscL family protein [Chloroflexi bacterium]|nr:MAG: MscL family protein [Chloroflexota bacterium]